MKITAIAQRTTTHLQVTKTVCDICKSEHEGDDWNPGRKSILETSVVLTEGLYYGDGGEKKITEYHVCPTCFWEKLSPFLASLGATPTVTEIDW